RGKGKAPAHFGRRLHGGEVRGARMGRSKERVGDTNRFELFFSKAIFLRKGIAGGVEAAELGDELGFDHGPPVHKACEHEGRLEGGSEEGVLADGKGIKAGPVGGEIVRKVTCRFTWELDPRFFSKPKETSGPVEVVGIRKK